MDDEILLPDHDDDQKEEDPWEALKEFCDDTESDDLDIPWSGSGLLDLSNESLEEELDSEPLKDNSTPNRGALPEKISDLERIESRLHQYRTTSIKRCTNYAECSNSSLLIPARTKEARYCNRCGDALEIVSTPLDNSFFSDGGKTPQPKVHTREGDIHKSTLEPNTKREGNRKLTQLANPRHVILELMGDRNYFPGDDEFYRRDCDLFLKGQHREVVRTILKPTKPLLKLSKRHGLLVYPQDIVMGEVILVGENKRIINFHIYGGENKREMTEFAEQIAERLQKRSIGVGIKRPDLLIVKRKYYFDCQESVRDRELNNLDEKIAQQIEQGLNATYNHKRFYVPGGYNKRRIKQKRGLFKVNTPALTVWERKIYLHDSTLEATVSRIKNQLNEDIEIDRSFLLDIKNS